jgi:hypothetical protein
MGISKTVQAQNNRFQDNGSEERGQKIRKYLEKVLLNLLGIMPWLTRK